KYPLSCTADTPQPLLSSFRLHQNYPNPFNSSTQITFELNRAGDVSLQVYNLIGQKVRTLVNGRKLVGTHRVKWNGRDDLGQPVASGVYIYCLSAGEHFVQSRKMLLLR
ncbi:MAG TPA: T9SS type A sorting domain-containing protein, partial [Caldithrix sp.]|nr:T9SS type A sorting domain-containing protein [Caldithrix sp.]